MNATHPNDYVELRNKYKASFPRILEHDGIIFANDPSRLDWLLAIKDVTVRPTDIWLCGCMKSGNTWLSEIVSLIMADGVIDEVITESIQIRVPNLMHRISKTNHLQWFENLDDPRIINTHLPIKYVPHFGTNIGKMIYIMRNPKDVCVSSYYHNNTLNVSQLKWEDICELFLNGDIVYGDWFQHLRDYWLTYGTNHANVLFVAYEELIADLPAMVRTIARFLDKQFTDKTIDTIVGHCSLKSMRDNPMANRSDYMTRFGRQDGCGAPFIRNGTVGDWKQHMTGQQSALFDERYGPPLRAIGLRVCDELADAERCMRATGRIIYNQ